MSEQLPERDEVLHRAAAARDRSAGLHGSLRASRTQGGWVEREVNAAGVRARMAMLADELAAARERIRNLEIALDTNRHIAMAIGIVMARRGLDETQAFDELRRESQRRHQKLRDVAEEVVYTGAAPSVDEG